MPTNSRRNKEKEAMKKNILDTATIIAKEDGISKISIRKIAEKIEYSPATIYLYFPDKESIIAGVLRSQYTYITESLSSAIDESQSPWSKIDSLTKAYFRIGLEMGEEYTTIMNNSSSTILENTAVLVPNAHEMRKAISILHNILKEIFQDSLSDEDILLRSQVIWAASYGLLARLIIEKAENPNYQQKLVDAHINFLLNGIRQEKLHLDSK